MEDDKTLDFQFPKKTQSIIKVIGVGGGGGNAVNHMYNEGIHDVSFALCNTDNQALSQSPVETRVQLGKHTTEGLGAGNRPEVAAAAAEESRNDLVELLSDGTRMAFVTAGMGGGTGTGAAPIVAGIAKELGILTVGIVTIPFFFEGRKKIMQALKGVENMARNVDALLVINNEKLIDIYADLTIPNAFAKADDTLTIAAKGIAEIITIHGHLNLDFADVKTILKDGGVAIMSSGYGEGDLRVEHAIQNALHSPLLNNNDVFEAKKVLLNIYSGVEKPLIVEEIAAIAEFMKKFDIDVEVIWGTAFEANLEHEVKVTLLATGFGMSSIPGIDTHLKELTEEEARAEEERLLQKEEEERRLSVMMKEHYGIDDSELLDKKGSKYFVPKPIVLSTDELDDDKIVDAMENTPVFKRDESFNPSDYEPNSQQSSELFND